MVFMSSLYSQPLGATQKVFEIRVREKTLRKYIFFKFISFIKILKDTVQNTNT